MNILDILSPQSVKAPLLATEKQAAIDELVDLLAQASLINDADKLKTVASFSILADMVKTVGGDRVEVTTLVGPNADAHVFSPTPADAKTISGADVFFVNMSVTMMAGLGFASVLTLIVVPTLYCIFFRIPSK